ncbi:hypothetical protein [Sinorhizobium fredii]|uniref:hypothetical protein n=1 Tax=Rhizobium fredii TaxID=380 RepID=UPI0004BA769F|nr:hypothetical protein [Sinorhizobium fredii]AWI60365.1 hypothetical protein AB395_00005188 [Sinorhizobium fredii CCBAU 45436]
MKFFDRHVGTIAVTIFFAFIGVCLFLLTYFGVFKEAYDFVVKDGRAFIYSTIDAVVVRYQLRCDHLMNIGLKDHCRVFYEDGYSVRIEPMSVEQQKEMFPGHPLSINCSDKAQIRADQENGPEWQRDSIRICTITE